MSDELAAKEEETMDPKVGQWLFSSCRAEDYGQITRVGLDSNGCQVVDILLAHPDEDLSYTHDNDTSDPEKSPGGFGFSPLTVLRVEPSSAHLTLVDVQYKTMGGGIECNTPGKGCFWCIKYFSLNDEPTPSRDPKPIAPDMDTAATSPMRDVPDVPRRLAGVLRATEPPLVDVTIRVVVDPDAPPDSWTVETFAMGLFYGNVGRNVRSPVAWFQAGPDARNKLRREAWAIMRVMGDIPLCPTGAGDRATLSYKALPEA